MEKLYWNQIEYASLLLQVDPQYYAFRWITLLMSQEFAFPDTLRIWDTILSDPYGRMDCLLRFCIAMILHVKPRLMQVGGWGKKGRKQGCAMSRQCDSNFIRTLCDTLRVSALSCSQQGHYLYVYVLHGSSLISGIGWCMTMHTHSHTCHPCWRRGISQSS